MPDVLIRDVPDDVLAAIDASAHQAGISRSEFLRRTLARVRPPQQVTVGDFTAFRLAFGDLGDPDVMKDAWS